MTKTTGVGRGGGWLKNRNLEREEAIKRIYVEEQRTAAEVAAILGITRPLVYGALKRLEVGRHPSGKRHTDPVARFWGFVEKTGTCWEWIGGRSGTGYGAFAPRFQKLVLAHRFSYELHNGPIPSGLVIDHLCRNRACVNPKHMEVVTRGENVLRGNGPPAKNREKTHCLRGHPLDEQNTYLYVKKSTGRPTRLCRTCRLHSKQRTVLHKARRDRGSVPE